VALANFMRLSLLKAAHAAVGECRVQESGSAILFGPRTLRRTWGTRPVSYRLFLDRRAGLSKPGSRISMFGYPDALRWKFDSATGLSIELPEARRPNDYAWGWTIRA
jgi:hypothetical protein